MQLHDTIWQWGSFTQEDEKEIFSILEIAKRPYELPNSVHVAINFELNLDLTVIDRQVYSLLDWLGDMGGMLEALVYLSTFVLAIINYGQFKAMLVSALFVGKR